MVEVEGGNRRFVSSCHVRKRETFGKSAMQCEQERCSEIEGQERWPLI